MFKSKKTLALVLGAASVLLASGCYKHSFTVGSGGDVNGTAAYSSWESHWLFGIIGEPSVDVKTVCPSGNATLKDKVTFLNGLVGAFVGAIWYPTTVEVYCDSGKAAKVTFTPAQLRAAAQRPQAMEFARMVSDTKAVELQSAIDAYTEATKNVATSGTPTKF
ncbi:MAG: hypothetical protein SFV15_24720 [Polyangiaceae bacterium]|nr:hypothetical protein [Polyangiaceae bacterium]